VGGIVVDVGVVVEVDVLVEVVGVVLVLVLVEVAVSGCKFLDIRIGERSVDLMNKFSGFDLSIIAK
jgi:hypothetical protein